MLILRALSYILLGATLSWASPSLISSGDISTIQAANYTTVQTARYDLGYNCAGSGFCGPTDNRGISFIVMLFFAFISDDDWYDNTKQIGANFLHGTIGSVVTFWLSFSVQSLFR
jgi:hypothetical protein